MNHTLESNRLFPYIAWTTVILFSFLTYTLAAKLHAELSEMERNTDTLEARLTTP
jgi:hypothetical protein